MNEGKAIVVQGNALNLPLPDESVDLICTSPPYFSLRSYRDDGKHYEGQMGSEATPADFLRALWAAADEMWRVLKPTGSCWIDLGDKYAGSGGHNNSSISQHGEARGPGRYNQASDVRTKSLMGLPWRFALGLSCPDPYRLIYDEGEHPVWINRAEVIWNKPNCISGGSYVYAKVKGRPLSIRVHDLCRAYPPEDVQLWNGQRWTQALWWQETGRHPEAEASYKAIRTARRRGGAVVVAGDVELELRSGERIGCTREHRWPTQRGLVAASDLLVGDVLEVSRLPDGDVVPEALDDEMVGWFVGLYIAEGSRSGKMIQIAGHVDELERFKRLQEVAAAFHGRCSVYSYAGKGATINLAGNFLHAIIDTYVGGRTAKDKHLQPKAWQRSHRFLRAVLNGYLSGDGGYDAKADRWQLGFTANDVLASDLRTLAARLGVSLRLRRGTVTGFGKEWPAWLGTLYMNPERRKRPDSEVVAIRQSRARRFWDIGVEDEPHLFALASGVLTHNSLPESVTDRVRRSHEQWFLFVKSPRYFAAMDEIREPQKEMERSGSGRFEAGKGKRKESGANRGFGVADGFVREYNPLGKLPGSVWSVPSEPLLIPEWAKTQLGLTDHFAAFSSELPRRIILGWSPSGICVECGQGRRPVVDKQYRVDRSSAKGDQPKERGRPAGGGGQPWGLAEFAVGATEATITGYACACTPYTDHKGTGDPERSAAQRGDLVTGRSKKPAGNHMARVGPSREYQFEGWVPPETRAAVILDPFSGTGTVPLVARMLGRIGVGVDLSHDYCKLAKWRVFDSGHGNKTIRKTWKERQGGLL